MNLHDIPARAKPQPKTYWERLPDGDFVVPGGALFVAELRREVQDLRYARRLGRHVALVLTPEEWRVVVRIFPREWFGTELAPRTFMGVPCVVV